MMSSKKNIGRVGINSKIFIIFVFQSESYRQFPWLVLSEAHSRLNLLGRNAVIPALLELNCNRIMQKAYKQKIKERGLKTTWIAEQLKISQPSLSMYLNGKRNIPADVDYRLKKLLYT